jgi:hypothetical protein
LRTILDHQKVNGTISKRTAVLISNNIAKVYFVCLFICLFWAAQSIFHLADVIITGDRAENLYLYLAPRALRIESYLTCHAYCDTCSLFFRSYYNDPWILLLDIAVLAKEQSLPILMTRVCLSRQKSQLHRY